MGRRFARSFRRLGAILSGLALLIAAPACLAAATFTYTLPTGQTGVIVLPPVEEFENGDHWDAYAADATADMNANTEFKGQVSYSFVMTDGAWAQAKMDLQAFINGAADKSRHFKDIGRDPPAYPDVARPGQLFATADGVLHRFNGSQWETIPVGATIDSPDGKHLKVDRRVLPAEAAQIDAAFQRAETAVAAERAKTGADAQAKAQVQSPAQVTPPAGDPSQSPGLNNSSQPAKGGAWPFLALVLVVAGAWVWWWFGPRRRQALSKAVATPSSPVAPDTPPD